ncbi:hypothetical protein ACLKA6_002638 [Drosophila palustris]
MNFSTRAGALLLLLRSKALYALSKSAGALLWPLRRSKALYALSVGAGALLWPFRRSKALYALSVGAGALLWPFRRSKALYALSVGAGALLGSLLLLRSKALYALSKSAGELLWLSWRSKALYALSVGAGALLWPFRRSKALYALSVGAGALLGSLLLLRSKALYALSKSAGALLWLSWLLYGSVGKTRPHSNLLSPTWPVNSATPQRPRGSSSESAQATASRRGRSVHSPYNSDQSQATPPNAEAGDVEAVHGADEDWGSDEESLPQRLPDSSAIGEIFDTEFNRQAAEDLEPPILDDEDYFDYFLAAVGDVEVAQDLPWEQLDWVPVPAGWRAFGLGAHIPGVVVDSVEVSGPKALKPRNRISVRSIFCS